MSGKRASQFRFPERLVAARRDREIPCVSRMQPGARRWRARCSLPSEWSTDGDPGEGWEWMIRCGVSHAISMLVGAFVRSTQLQRIGGRYTIRKMGSLHEPHRVQRELQSSYSRKTVNPSAMCTPTASPAARNRSAHERSRIAGSGVWLSWASRAASFLGKAS